MSKLESVGTLGDVLGIQKSELKTGFTVIPQQEFSKAEEDLLRTKALEVEDSDVYDTLAKEHGRGANVIPTTYNPVQLATLVQQNNTLGQAVAAMEVNVDGTGFEILDENDEQPGDNDKQAEYARLFFDEPFPNVSFLTLRREMRRDIEETGNGYLEVIRNVKGDITFIRRMDAKLTRLVRYGDPVVVTQELERAGKTTTVKMWSRERRYMQFIGTKFVYFREFGASRQLHLQTGYWEDDPRMGEVGIPEEYQASEVIHFTAVKDVLTPYGVPRWINNIPSVLGSRKAEELNLHFFNTGGVPPVMVIVQGGVMDPEGKKQITQYLSGKAEAKNRAVLMEVVPSTTSMDGKGSSVRVTVERFGAEQQNDSMFEKYDEKCAQRVRGAFRLPPLFLGLAQDYNFATAHTAYMIAEAQVFQPERIEFDDVINRTIMKELYPAYKFRSLPLSVKDVERQLKAIEMSRDTVERDSFVDAVNEVADLNLVMKEEEEMDPGMMDLLGELTGPAGNPAQAVQPGQAGELPPENTNTAPAPVEKVQIIKANDTLLDELASDWAAHLSGTTLYETEQVKTMVAVIKSLAPPVRKIFNGYVGMKMMSRDPINPEETYELMQQAGESLLNEE